MSKLLEQLKSGKSIKEILAEDDNPIRNRINPVNMAMPELPRRPGFLTTMPARLQVPEPESKPERVNPKPVAFDAGKLKAQIRDVLSKSVSTSYGIIQFLSDETGIPVEQIMKVVLDMLKETFPKQSSQNSLQPEVPAEKPKIAFPTMQGEFPDIADESSEILATEPAIRKPTLQERAMKDASGQSQVAPPSGGNKWD